MSCPIPVAHFLLPEAAWTGNTGNLFSHRNGTHRIGARLFPDCNIRLFEMCSCWCTVSGSYQPPFARVRIEFFLVFSKNARSIPAHPGKIIRYGSKKRINRSIIAKPINKESV